MSGLKPGPTPGATATARAVLLQVQRRPQIPFGNDKRWEGPTHRGQAAVSWHLNLWGVETQVSEARLGTPRFGVVEECGRLGRCPRQERRDRPCCQAPGLVASSGMAVPLARLDALMMKLLKNGIPYAPAWSTECGGSPICNKRMLFWYIGLLFYG